MEMQMEWSYVGAVVISGLAIVFVALILLIAAVWVMGRIFTAVKSGKSGGGDKPKEITPAPQPKNDTPSVSADAEDESEIIAVIAAAVGAQSAERPSEYTASSVQEAPPRQIPGQEPHAAKTPEHFKRKGKFLCYQYFGIP